MAGNTDLQKVLSSIQISCDEIEYGFVCIDEGIEINLNEVTGTFREQEGLTVIASLNYLKSKNLKNYEGPFAKLTIDVHTSLELVGLTATLATKLGESNISANVVAAYYHDHIFVQYDLKDVAIEALNALARQ